MQRTDPGTMPKVGASILIIEDDKRIAMLVQKMLEQEKFGVELVHDGLKARERLKSHNFALVLLDIALPNKSGFEILSSIRAEGDKVPVIILSGRRKTQDRIKGLELGADDFVIKPFDSGELLARIGALLRRNHSLRDQILQAGDLEMDTGRRSVTRGTRQINLSPREFALLEFMLRNKNRVLTRSRIAEQVWGYTFDTGTNIVDVYMTYLRKAIDEGFQTKLLHTLYGEGFMLTDK